MTRRLTRFGSVCLLVLQFAFLLDAIQRPAYGYVDPGSGLLVAQFLSSMIGGGIFFLRKRLRGLFSRKPADSKPNAEMQS